MAPSHSSFSICRNTFENLVCIAPLVMAYGYHSTIHKAYTGASPKGEELEKEYQFEEHPLLQFYKSIIGYRIREIPLHAASNTAEVVMLEITVSAEMKQEKNSHNFTV